MKFYLINLLSLFSISLFSQTAIVIGTGTNYGTSVPVASWYNSSATESIYTGTEIGSTGIITKIGYQKASGNSTTEPNVKMYMKMTALASTGIVAYTLGNENFSSYTLVYDGNIPNSSTSGLMEVTLNSPFSFTDLSKNLSVLVVGSTCISSGRPQFRYTTISTRMSAGFNDGTIGCEGNNAWSATSTFSPSLERPNIALTFSPLSTVNFEKNRGISVSVRNKKLEIVSQNSSISEVQLFDLTGRKIGEIKNVSKNIIADLDFETQILIVKVRTEDNKIVTKKIIL